MMGDRPLSPAQMDMLSEAPRLIEGEEQHASKFQHGIYNLQKARVEFQWSITVLDTATTLSRFKDEVGSGEFTRLVLG